jgi:signal transduction histidine kinase
VTDRTELGRAEAWIRALGFAIWAFVGISRLDGVAAAWLPAWLGYGAAFAIASLYRRIPRLLAVAALVAQAAGVIAMPHLGLVGFEGLLMAIVAVQVPMVLSLRAGIVWAVAQLPFVLGTVAADKRAVELLEIAGAYSTFTAFAFLVYWLYGQERRARRQLARAHADLLATRALVVDGVRQAERLRISRELHDSLGHHLTAMAIQLEVAEQSALGDAAEPVARARAETKDALAELRRTIAAMQRDETDFVASVRALASGIPHPHIHVAADDALRIDDRETSHGLFRVIQEAITNSVKHAGADHVWVDVESGQAGVVVEVRDDGAGATGFVEGAGLRGIRARVAQLGGTVELGPSRDGGFRVRASIPGASP